MALSISTFLSLYLAFVLSASTVAEERLFDFNITWVTTNPDAAFERTTIGINGQWPIPRIEVNKGDRLIINVNNQLGNESTSLHFHGIYQTSSTEMDGVPGVTQCSISPGSSFTYNFTINQPGTVSVVPDFTKIET